AGRAWPALASVPLPRGRVRSAEALWLAAPGGDPALAQMRALERWPDGSVRWLLVDFLADVARGAHATYTLRDGKRPKAASSPRLRMDTARDGSRTLDSGVLRATVPARDAALLSPVAAGAAPL